MRIKRTAWNKGLHTGIKPWLGKKRSEEDRKKMSDAKKGKFPLNLKKFSIKGKQNNTGRTHFKKGFTPWNKGLKGFNEGEKNIFWEGGITPINVALRLSFDYEEFRKKVFERDLYICQECKKIGGYLHVDHIKSFAKYPELRFEVSNGRTLCVPCHYKITFNKEIPINSKWGHRKEVKS